MHQDIRFCTSRDGIRVACATSGSGPPLVRAAHWLTHLEHDAASPVWRHWLRALSQDHTLVRYDLRGCGLSDRDAADLSFDAFVGDLESVVDGLGLERFALLGPSQGAAVAIAYAARHPGRVTRLVLYGGYARGRYRRGDDAGQRAEADLLLGVGRVGWSRENPAFRQVFATLFRPDATPGEMQSFAELQRLSASTDTAAKVREAFYGVDVSDAARRVQAPTLVLHARHDAMVPFEEARHVAALIPRARLLTLDSRNHLLREDEPAWRELTGALGRFLEPDVASPPPLLTGDPTRPGSAPRSPALSRREREVLECMARGLSNAEIAATLGVTPKTLEKHVTSIFRKLEVTSRARAIVRAREAGFGASGAVRPAPPAR
ncbi:MAG TPA: alpha/beta fold hydrolase [Gemmatimonadaceae bacterium]